MGQEELQKHLDASRYGTPKLKPDEQKKYMGTFRERCFVTMTIAQMKIEKDKKNFLKELTAHPDGTVLLNGKMDIALQTAYIKMINAQGGRFTVVNEAQSSEPDALGLVLAADHAVDVTEVDIDKKYPDTPEQKPAEKEGFWKSLFH
ncbi:YueI family protein [uncultured Enterococcus sp.]|uniref:YueI family protein n=1 Tax=uncultured Enterococcus sp. TaxID=167972 RepID=UPI002AA603AF|nr:YueI family protein [uncultured Enterococcus sp.]